MDERRNANGDPNGTIGESAMEITIERTNAYERREAGWRSAPARERLVETARGLGVDRVYVDLTAAATAKSAEADRLATDIKRLAVDAAAAGIEIGAVSGDPWWPSTQGQIDARRVLDFVAEVNRDDVVIQALHIDAEPLGLEEWPETREPLTVAFLDFVAALEEYGSTLETPAPLAFLVSCWFDESNGLASKVTFDRQSRYPYEHLASVVSDTTSIVVTAYRNKDRRPGHPDIEIGGSIT